jgi:lysophospholipase L1-like esterase
MKRTTVLGFLAASALAVTALPGAGHARPAAHTPGTFYLALGDSLSAGFQPDTSIAWTHGWVFQFDAMLNKVTPVQVTDIAIPGECSDTLIKGGLNADCSTKTVDSPSQLAEAVSFIKAHPGQVNPITVEIGGNDLNGHKTELLGDTPLQQATLLGKLFPVLIHNWATTFGALRQACPTCTIIAVDQYNPFPAGSLKTSVAPAFVDYNQFLAKTAAPFKVKVADVYTPFVGHELAYTWMAKGDIHANDTGYAMMAGVVAKASGFAIPAN